MTLIVIYLFIFVFVPALECSCTDPMDALYSSEPLAPRWWEKVSESEYLERTSPLWGGGAAAAGLQSLSSGEDLALQPPCVGVDVLLQFCEESLVLDVRPRGVFDAFHFKSAVSVGPRDAGELAGLLKEGQLALPDPRGVLLQVQKLGSSRPLIGKAGRAAAAAGLEAAAGAAAAAAAAAPAAPDPQEAAAAKRAQGGPPAPRKPWISPTMSRLPLIVVMGDKEDTGAGLARRLLAAGVSCVCVLLGGIDAVQLDAPNHFLTRKRQT